jgi:GNAT superfamily N-acetyltransferase
VRSQDGLVAAVEGAVVGFCTWRPWYDRTREITWLAVHADVRRQGIGAALVERLAEACAADGVANLVVTTLAESVPEPGVTDGYAGTRRFYQNRGFEPLWEPDGWWTSENQAVLMLRRLVP